MKDVTFDDLIDEVHRDFPIRLPRKVIRVIIKSTLNRMFNILAKSNTAISIRGSAITKFYNRIDFNQLKRDFMDIDETKESDKKLIDVHYLKLLDAKGSPRLRVRGKRDRTLVYHRGVN